MGLEDRRDAAWLICNLTTDKRNVMKLLQKGVLAHMMRIGVDTAECLCLREYALRALRHAANADLPEVPTSLSLLV